MLPHTDDAARAAVRADCGVGARSSRASLAAARRLPTRAPRGGAAGGRRRGGRPTAATACGFEFVLMGQAGAARARDARRAGARRARRSLANDQRARSAPTTRLRGGGGGSAIRGLAQRACRRRARKFGEYGGASLALAEQARMHPTLSALLSKTGTPRPPRRRHRRRAHVPAAQPCSSTAAASRLAARRAARVGGVVHERARRRRRRASRAPRRPRRLRALAARHPHILRCTAGAAGGCARRARREWRRRVVRGRARRSRRCRPPRPARWTSRSLVRPRGCSRRPPPRGAKGGLGALSDGHRICVALWLRARRSFVVVGSARCLNAERQWRIRASVDARLRRVRYHEQAVREEVAAGWAAPLRRRTRPRRRPRAERADADAP